VQRVAYQDASLFNVHLSLDGPPHWHAAGFDPAIDRAWIVNLGYETTGDFTAELGRVRAGAPPSGRHLNIAVNSLYDPTDAPPGHATGLIRAFAPYALADGGAAGWRRAAAAVADRCVARWAEASPDLGRLVRKRAVETPADIAEKIINYRFGDWMVGRIHPDNLLEHRPTDELSGYRTPVPGLYLCGASQHPHGYITFAPGYNCAGVMAADLGVPAWWKTV
jgi:phytoene dehydrogenase-like protein